MPELVSDYSRQRYNSLASIQRLLADKACEAFSFLGRKVVGRKMLDMLDNPDEIVQYIDSEKFNAHEAAGALRWMDHIVRVGSEIQAFGDGIEAMAEKAGLPVPAELDVADRTDMEIAYAGHPREKQVIAVHKLLLSLYQGRVDVALIDKQDPEFFQVYGEAMDDGEILGFQITVSAKRMGELDLLDVAD
jgi:hypothetical protein